MTSAMRVEDVHHRYRRTVALRGCSLDIPAGSVTALVGPNGAGKTTLLQIAVGLLTPTSGAVLVGAQSVQTQTPQVLALLGFVAHDAPLYGSFTVAEMLRAGRQMNPRWDDGWARARIREVGVPADRRCRALSSGQRAQVALTLAVAKRPDVLLLDEPLARLDPLARDEFLRSLMEVLVDRGITVVMSSHLVADLERVCDRLAVLVDGRVVLAGGVDTLMHEHRRVAGTHDQVQRAASTTTVVDMEVKGDQAAAVLRGTIANDGSRLSIDAINLEQLVLAYLRARSSSPLSIVPSVEVAS